MKCSVILLDELCNIYNEYKCGIHSIIYINDNGIYMSIIMIILFINNIYIYTCVCVSVHVCWNHTSSWRAQGKNSRPKEVLSHRFHYFFIVIDNSITFLWQLCGISSHILIINYKYKKNKEKGKRTVEEGKPQNPKIPKIYTPLCKMFSFYFY